MKHLVLPIAIEDGILTVATPDPFNAELMEDLGRVTQHKVKAVVSSKTDIVKSINEFFGFKRSIALAEDLFATTGVDLGNLEQYVKLKSADELPPTDQHIVNAVNHLLVYAFDQRASDIHIEPKRDEMMVRMRIDGVLHTVYRLPKKVHNAIVSRIKTLSRLDMAEKRRPQDGRIKTDRGGLEAEIRISTLPVAFGEKVVMRIMDPSILFQDLKGLGFTPADLKRYDQFISMPHGMVIVCGPTGSGKSTSLYALLKILNKEERNIITLEDPIEYNIEGLNQSQINPEIGYTFASGLRTILRQDPNVIMVGEIRDSETAELATHAALTGHLMFSTLHTNTAAGAIARLIDMGIEPFLLSSSLRIVVAQRLVRRICEKCKEELEIPQSIKNRIIEELKKMPPGELKKYEVDISKEIKFYHGKGCDACNKTGLRGRVAIYEAIPVNDGIKLIITEKNGNEELVNKERESMGALTIKQDGILKIIKGLTTIEEIERVTEGGIALVEMED